MQRLSWAERWFRDALEVLQPPAFFQSQDVDVSRIKAAIGAARGVGLRLTYTHYVVRAVAASLAKHPDLHRLVIGSRAHRPTDVLIGLSVAGQAAVAPVMVLRNPHLKSVEDVQLEIHSRLPGVQQADAATIRALDRWGWVVPFSILRKGLLRLAFQSFAFRQRGVGTFQVSVVPTVNESVAPMFSTTAILVAGQVQDRAVVVEGAVAVRPVMRLTLSADHRVWNGMDGARFLGAVQNELQN